MDVGRGSPAVMVRLPQDLKTWLQRIAIRNRRSLNSEVLHRLEQSRKAEEPSGEETQRCPLAPRSPRPA